MNLPVFAACNLGGFTDPWHVRWKERVSTSSSASKCANSFTTMIHPWYLTCNSTPTTCVHHSVNFCKKRGAGRIEGAVCALDRVIWDPCYWFSNVHNSKMYPFKNCAQFSSEHIEKCSKFSNVLTWVTRDPYWPFSRSQLLPAVQLLLLFLIWQGFSDATRAGELKATLLMYCSILLSQMLPAEPRLALPPLNMDRVDSFMLICFLVQIWHFCSFTVRTIWGLKGKVRSHRLTRADNEQIKIPG